MKNRFELPGSGQAVFLRSSPTAYKIPDLRIVQEIAHHLVHAIAVQIGQDGNPASSGIQDARRQLSEQPLCGPQRSPERNESDIPRRIYNFKLLGVIERLERVLSPSLSRP